MLMLKGKTYLPKAYIEEVIKEHYNNLLQGYPGITKTLRIIEKTYTRPKIKEEVENYIKKCVLCQQNKVARYKKYRQVQFTPIIDTLQDEVIIDFIIKLLRLAHLVTKEKYDLILVVVDKLTKYSLIILFKENYNIEQLRFVLLNTLVKDHGLPKVITLDRDKLFISNYQKTLTAHLGIKQRMSIVFYLETDSQIEQINQTLEAYLRHYINY